MGAENRGQFVKVVGSSVTIGGTAFRLDGDGQTVYGASASRPTAANMHAAVPFGFYYAVDTQVISQTDGTSWYTV